MAFSNSTVWWKRLLYKLNLHIFIQQLSHRAYNVGRTTNIFYFSCLFYLVRQTCFISYLGFTHWNQQILNQFMPSELPVINSVSSKLDVKQMLLFSDQVSRKERVVGFFVDLLTFALFTLPGGGGRGVLPYIRLISMCRSKGNVLF